MSQLTAPAVPAASGISAGPLRRAARWIERRLWLVLPLLAIPALAPFARIGLPGSADGMLHLLRLALLDYHIAGGTLYPRWVPELFAGLGYPVFNFYGPLSYYLAELLHLAGLDFVSALIASFALLVVFSGFGMYRLALDVFGADQRWAALVAAAAYMYAPYLLTNVYIRGAVAEVGAQALLPWVLWSTRRLLTAARPQPYILALALSLGGLAITHNITLLFTPLVLVGYAGVVWWQGGCERRRLGWLVAGIAAAAGVSAFFWLPLIGERQYLAGSAYTTAAQYLHENVWTLGNFLDTAFAYGYTFDVPFQLGLVQAGLALAGLIVARRRDPEWLFFLALAVLVGLGISVWSLPLWLGNDILLIAQYPWRLLTFLSVALALFTGAILVRLRRDLARVAIACALLVLIIAANRPQVDWMLTLARAGESVALPAVSQFEYETGAIGTGSAQEFRPRWSTGPVYGPPGESAADPLPADQVLTVEQGNAYDLRLSAASSQGGPLRFASLYYPAWQATLSDGSPLAIYPSTNLGLLTVDLPAGRQEVMLRWTGTPLQHVADWISLVTLALLAGFAWRYSRPRWLALAPLGLLVLGLAAVLVHPAPVPVNRPDQPVEAGNFRMAGYRLEQSDQGQIYVLPYWYVRQTPPAETLVKWRLSTAAGEVVSQTSARPYFNSQSAANWPPATLVDDAYRLALPPGLPAGSYDLAVQVAEGNDVTEWTPVGVVEVAQTVPAQPVPDHPLDASFGGLVRLAGFDLAQEARAGDRLPLLVVQPGDRLDYTLFWQALQPLHENYHSFIHLTDRQGQALVKRDQVAGSFLHTPMSWDVVSLQPDRYTLRIPEDAPSGLLWPITGLYEFQSLQLLPATDAAGQSLGDSFRLPPVKVLGDNPDGRPQHQVSARLGELATLTGYDLSLPDGPLQPGSRFDVTLYYRVDGATDQDLTQFVQLYSPELGMAGQQDAPPQNGANPTWAWVPGEIVTDTRTVQVRDDAAPGQYRLLAGLYDPANGTRVPAADGDGAALPDGQVVLTELTIAR